MHDNYLEYGPPSWATSPSCVRTHEQYLWPAMISMRKSTVSFSFLYEYGAPLGGWAFEPQELRYLTIRLWARDFYEVCFGRILTEINADNSFQLFFHVLLNFTCKQTRRNWTVLGKIAAVYARTRFFNIFKFLKSRNRKCAFFSILGQLTTPLHLNFLLKLRKNCIIQCQ